MKISKFLKLSPGTRTMKEYLHSFNNLAHYAQEFVNKDTKKIVTFKEA